MTRRAHVDSIDALRGLSILLVLIHHLALFGPLRVGEPPALLVRGLRVFASSGNWGVHLFLVISGFCLYLPMVGRESGTRWGDFYRRRVLRIMPPYLVALALAVPIAVAMGIARFDLVAVLEHALLLHQFVPGIENYNGSFWTLALEFQLYLVMPGFVFLFRRMGPWGTFALVTLFSLGYRALVWSHFDGRSELIDRSLGYALPARMPEFVLGMVFAALYAQNREIKGTRAGIAALAIMPTALLAMQVQKEGRFAPLTDAAVLVPMGLVGALVLFGPGRAVGRWKWLSGLGLVSYSVYLVHQPLILWSYPRLVGAGMGAWVATVACLVLVLAACLAFYFAVERPSLRLKNLGRRDPAPASTSAASSTIAP